MRVSNISLTSTLFATTGVAFWDALFRLIVFWRFTLIVTQSTCWDRNNLSVPWVWSGFVKRSITSFRLLLVRLRFGNSLCFCFTSLNVKPFPNDIADDILLINLTVLKPLNGEPITCRYLCIVLQCFCLVTVIKRNVLDWKRNENVTTRKLLPSSWIRN